jgi:hypothetical protein
VCLFVMNCCWPIKDVAVKVSRWSFNHI